MPIVRYVVFASIFAVALLLLLDRSLPQPAERAAGPEAARATIRIHSARALPEKIIFDTSTRIAATVSTPLLAADAPDRGTSGALTMLETRTPDVAASRRDTARAAGLHSNRNGRAASSRLSTRQVTAGAF
ncbi:MULTISPECIES: hypothetical protein [Bradyrhizobium]|uniref:Uncharacterized protein n=1 Tax=Bradyrhizobium yuanmingense TaxID=108015 RepID=A0A0R3CMW0_9BRAD|nr:MULTISPECIES: hypothetical protein [Bradyrhizobium]KRP96289.1 hypothetical protein AOQ72_18365 [Bradyrhizobium yuanmingense]MCA1437168.1 hypothetical protein [Bradyrhizobium sp. BRP20]MCA1472928.1 hypothetical protein [Bradyrhizobium sp. IC3195]MCA1513786.1 hypothetical protein [Bradyrhizobium sp. NBAIM01]MCA1526080.1 hypothetical protein [Bradyrhizobium yuanmingense]